MEKLVKDIHNILKYTDIEKVNEGVAKGSLSWYESGFYGTEEAEKTIEAVASILIANGYQIKDKGVGNDVMCGFDGLVGIKFTA